MLNADASADSVIITIDNNNSGSSSDNNNNDSRRRQRDHDGGIQLTNDDNNSSSFSSAPSQRQPHHVMTQPVFLQLIFPFVPTKKFSTPLLFNSVSTSWSETIQHYSGAQLCWNALVRSGVMEKDDEHGNDDDADRSATDCVANRFIQLLNRVITGTSFVLPAALDTILMLPDEIAKLIVARMDKYSVENSYRRQYTSVQVLEQLFSIVERFEGATALKNRLEQICIYHLVKCEHSIAAHYFDTLTRLGVDWKAFFSEELSSVPTTFAAIVKHSTSTQTYKMAIDLCRGVSDDFMKSLLEQRRRQSGRACYTIMNYACHQRDALAAEFVQILLDTMKELYGTTSEMFNRGVFTAEDFGGSTPIINLLIKASGVEQLCDTTSSSTLLQLSTRYFSLQCTQAIIDRCRELGGSELVRRQLELTGAEDECPPFAYSFLDRSFELKKAQYFVELAKEFGTNFLKEQLWKTNSDGNTLFSAACTEVSAEHLEYVLNDVFKSNNFTDEEILAHFQHRNNNNMNVLMLVSNGSNDSKYKKVNLLTSELLRLQQQATSSSPSQQQQQRNSLLKDMLEQESSDTHYTPLMYVLSLFCPYYLMRFLFDLYRDECAASVDEMKHHLRGALRVCFRKYPSSLTFTHLWQACVDFKDDVFLKSVLEIENSNSESGNHQSSVLARSVTRHGDTFILSSVLPYLVKFDLFDEQYKTLNEEEKTRLKKEGIDENTPLRIKLKTAEKQLSSTKSELETTKMSLEESEEKLAAALTELSTLKEKKI